MANVNKIKAQGNVYDIEDTVARTSVVAVTSKADGTVELTSRNSTVTLPSLTNFGDPSELENDVVTEISDLKSRIAQNSGLSAEVKQALMNCFNYVAWKNNDPNAQTYIDALQSALYPPATLSYITAVYSQGSTVVREGDSLDDLKADLVVTAYMNNGSSNVVANYVLSGELTEGISVITVTYGGKTATFNVTVSESERHMPSNYTWLYDPRQGELLSEQSYVTKSGNGTETINENGELVLHCDNNGGTAATNVLFSFPLTDTTTTNGILSVRARLIDLAILDSATPIGQRLQLSNGSSGCSIYLGKEASGSNIRVQYYEGSAKKTIDTDFAIDELHVFEVKLQNGTQSFSIDGTEIFSTTTLSSSYTSNNVIRLQATSTARTPNGLTTAFDWIAYYEQ